MSRELNLSRSSVNKTKEYTCSPTADGTGIGVIPDDADVVYVGAVADANNWLTLPTPTPGKFFRIINLTGTGMEIRSTSPTTVAINGGTGAGAESAVASTAIEIDCLCISSTKWLLNSRVAAGTYSAVEAAA